MPTKIEMAQRVIQCKYRMKKLPPTDNSEVQRLAKRKKSDIQQLIDIVDDAPPKEA